MQRQGGKMRKIHTRAKRKHGLSTMPAHRDFFHPMARNRPKTFKTEEAAHAWAAKQGMNPGQYVLEKAKRNRKFKIVEKA